MLKYFFFLLFLVSVKLNAQNIGIGTNTPNSSAVLDISHNSKGLLIPRMSMAQRLLIVNPSDGLLVYQTDSTRGFWYFDGVKWMNMVAVAPAGLVNSISCAGAVNNGTLISGSFNSGVTSIVPYTGGNGGTYAAQSVASTGVTGLTATLPAGVLAGGNGNLTYTISGTPSGSGTASFAISIGGQNCTLNRNVVAFGSFPSGTVFCGGTQTAVVNVVSPTTGKVWMNRNLGASRVATSATDAQAYGDLYQWGRGADGHQCTNSPTTNNLSTGDQPGNSSFILSSGGDWRTTSNNNLWMGVNGINNPCPIGYRLPSEVEFDNERQTWSSQTPAGAFASPLKLPSPGARLTDGFIYGMDEAGYYWCNMFNSANVDPIRAPHMFFYGTSGAGIYYLARANGFSVRCIRD